MNNDNNEYISYGKQYIAFIKEIEEAKLDLQNQFAEKRAKLWKENQEYYGWLLDLLSDLRKERVTFQKKSISEINQSLRDGGVDDELTKKWMQDIANFYHNDISMAQKMLAIDISSIDDSIFENLKQDVVKKIEKLECVIQSEIVDTSTSTEDSNSAGNCCYDA